jgi:hypothetical protein
MTRPLIQIGDDVRAMTDAEFAQYQQDAADAAVAATAAAAIVAARESARMKLAALGLTEAEVSALFGV